MENEPKKETTDLLGLAPYGEASKIAVQGFVDGAGAFLGAICMPAAEEFGLALKDKVSHWRARNAYNILDKSEKIYHDNGLVNMHAHPRIVYKIMEEGSWFDDEQLQNMWAGLLTSSCSSDGEDQSNLIYINLLSQLVRSQVKILEYGCNNATIRQNNQGLMLADLDILSIDEVLKIVGNEDLELLDRDLDHLRSLDLISSVDMNGGGIDFGSGRVSIIPSPLALHLFCRSKGFSGSLQEFYSGRVNT